MIDAPLAAPPAGMPDCREAMAVLWDFLDGELSPEREAALRAHLDACQPCFKHHEFERAFLAALASARATRPAPASLRARVTETLRAQGLLP